MALILLSQSSDFVSGSHGDCKCGLAKRTNRIVGGQETEVNEYPWQVKLEDCGGSLISDQWVLTAAHCIDPVHPDTYAHFYKVKLGAHNIDLNETQSVEIPIAKVELHRGYHHNGPRGLINDFALIKMDYPVDFSLYPHIRPICLPSRQHAGDFADASAIVTGWGDVKDGGLNSNVLLETQLKVHSNNDCIRKTSWINWYIPPSSLCASAPEGIEQWRGPCQGDSGGPLITASGGDGQTAGQNYELIGVVSYGSVCGNPILPAVFARVTEAFNFIDSVAGNLNTCPRV